MEKAYKDIPVKDIILRDQLALDRTILANERTFLSYVRTTLAIVVVGVTLIHLSDEPLMDGIGILAVLVGIAIIIVGIKRTLSMSRAIYAKTEKKVTS